MALHPDNTSHLRQPGGSPQLPLGGGADLGGLPGQEPEIDIEQLLQLLQQLLGSGSGGLGGGGLGGGGGGAVGGLGL